jgi:cellulose synthase/poly-beta-1,6-N-acetylglucosamine synthase-like glycosyltransferase
VIVFILSIAAIGAACLLSVPVAVLLGEVLAAVALPRRAQAPIPQGVRPRIAVLVPAHDESDGILPTLQDIKAQLAAGDRLLVVADNCCDDTAAVAAAAGGEVSERQDSARIGKSYALDHGFRHLGADPPEVVIVIDADCRLADGAIMRLAAACIETGRPVQALYLMQAPEEAAVSRQVANFAWRVKNWVRPLGLAALGLPCQLVGTGMALPWRALSSVEVASGAIVEDLKLGLELTAAGHPPVFCPAAVVTSAFPRSEEGAATQRQRWEQGHIGLIVWVVPRLVRLAIARRNWPLLALALDLAVPPIALLAILLVSALIMSGLAAVAGISDVAFQISAVASLAFAISVLLAWWTHGRCVLPVASLLEVPAYVLDKCRLYAGLLAGKRAAQWIRTDRR